MNPFKMEASKQQELRTQNKISVIYYCTCKGPKITFKCGMNATSSFVEEQLVEGEKLTIDERQHMKDIEEDLEENIEEGEDDQEEECDSDEER
jgi:hypothetical protein